MYSQSEQFHDTDGSALPITLQELAAKVGEIPGLGITLRPLSEEDAQAYFDLIEFDRPHLSQPADTTADKYKTVDDVSRSIIEPENPFKLRFGIWDDSIMVGSINLTPAKEHTAEIGYWVGQQHTRKGYATRAVKTLTEFAFDGLGYSALEAEVVYGNNYSKKTLESCGFDFDGWRKYEDIGDSKSPKHGFLFWTFVKNRPE